MSGQEMTEVVVEADAEDITDFIDWQCFQQ